MAKSKHNSERGIRQRRHLDHESGVKVVTVELSDGDTAWQPGTDEPISGPATVIYHLHDDGSVGVLIGPPPNPLATA